MLRTDRQAAPPCCPRVAPPSPTCAFPDHLVRPAEEGEGSSHSWGHFMGRPESGVCHACRRSAGRNLVTWQQPLPHYP